jgi:hypothetical protein
VLPRPLIFPSGLHADPPFDVTVTVNEAEAVLRCVSVAVHCTVVVPTGNSEPDAGVQPELATASSGSLNVTVYETTAPDGPVAAT